MGNVLTINCLGLLCILVNVLIAQPSFAAESPWTKTLSIDFLKGGYNGDTLKENLGSIGIGGTLQYLDSHRVSLAYQRTEIDFAEATGIPDSDVTLSQDTWLVEASTAYFLDLLSGKLSSGLQYQSIAGDLSDSNLGDMNAGGIILRYSNYAQTFYGDIHFSRSSYDQDIDIDQSDIAIGSSIFGPQQWLQIRLYHISSPFFDNDYISTDIMFKQWYSAYAPITPNSFSVAFTAGERLLAIDPDSQSAWNLNEEQTQYIRVGFNWISLKKTTKTLLFAYSSFQDFADNKNTYNNYAIYFNISQEW